MLKTNVSTSLRCLFAKALVNYGGSLFPYRFICPDVRPLRQSFLKKADVRLTKGLIKNVIGLIVVDDVLI